MTELSLERPELNEIKQFEEIKAKRYSIILELLERKFTWETVRQLTGHSFSSKLLADSKDPSLSKLSIYELSQLALQIKKEYEVSFLKLRSKHRRKKGFCRICNTKVLPSQAKYQNTRGMYHENCWESKQVD